MIINRTEKTSNFTIIDNAYLKDSELSFKAKGILTYILSLPDSWVIYIDQLITTSKEGEVAFRSGLSELIKKGYIKRYPVMENGSISRWETEVNERVEGNKEPVSPKEEKHASYEEDVLIAKLSKLWQGQKGVKKDESFDPYRQGLVKLAEKYGENTLLRAIENTNRLARIRKNKISIGWFFKEENFRRLAFMGKS
ncbi:hypothetical protein [uncultured Anaerococcus sp.]|uniref:hypothetical protein n=1 Tax=uncultured Anaerococcus sp. TaxID=293428 RepID=UPI002618208E|nr:hypothetical protein [uncultured Anaerococcus sp.]